MYIKIIYFYLLCIIFIVPKTIISFGFENNIEINEMIHNLYEGETNETYQKIAIEVMEKTLYQKNDNYVSDGIFVCKVPYSEEVLYYLHTVGLNSHWPRYIRNEDTIDIYIKDTNGMEYDSCVEDIKEIYNFITLIKNNTINMNDIEKINYFQTVINNMLEYDYTDEIIYKPNDVLEKRKAICTGYSTLFYLCCINTGIQCECIGNENHMWNRVYIDNSWKHIDLTWNDTFNENKWYLISESELDENHILADYFKEPKIPITIIKSAP